MRLKQCALATELCLCLFAAAPSPASAQYDLNTCSGNLSYCTEQARRSGQSNAACEAGYQDCMRRGMWSRQQPYSPRSPTLPVERK